MPFFILQRWMSCWFYSLQEYTRKVTDSKTRNYHTLIALILGGTEQVVFINWQGGSLPRCKRKSYQIIIVYNYLGFNKNDSPAHRVQGESLPWRNPVSGSSSLCPRGTWCGTTRTWSGTARSGCAASWSWWPGRGHLREREGWIKTRTECRARFLDLPAAISLPWSFYLNFRWTW